MTAVGDEGEGRSDALHDELGRRPALSSGSPGPTVGSHEWETPPVTPRGVSLAKSPKGPGPAALVHGGDEGGELEEGEDPVEEELVQGILSAGQRGMTSLVPPLPRSPGGPHRHEGGGGMMMGADPAGISHVTDVAAMAASAQVAGGTLPPSSFMGSLTFVQVRVLIQVQMMAFIVVFSASGLVSLDDMIFAVIVSAYSLFLALWAFPVPHGRASAHMRAPPPRVFNDSRLFKLHVALGAVLGLFLPLSYVLGGFARGDHEAVQSATPHLFLLCCQVLTENFLVTLPWCSLPVRALVPMMYNVRRLFSLAAWMRSLHGHLSPGATVSAAAPELIGAAAALGAMTGPTNTSQAAHPYWNAFGQILAAANLIYWALNLFFFLVPVFLPMAFKRHFEAEREAEREAMEGQHVDGGRKKWE